MSTEDEFDGLRVKHDTVWSKDGKILFLDEPDKFGVIKITFEVLTELLKAAGWQPDSDAWEPGS